METRNSTVSSDQPRGIQAVDLSITTEAWLWAALGTAVILALWVQWPRILDPYAIMEDARNFYWWHSFEEPSLFAFDPLFYGYFSNVHLGPVTLIIWKLSPGYSLLFQMASIFVSPVLFSKLLVFPVLLIAVYYLYAIGRMLTGPGTAFALCLAYVIFNLASPSSISATSGLQRSFMLTLLLGLLYYLMQERYRAATVVIFLSGTLYAPAFVLGVATYGLLLLRPQAKSWRTALDWRQLATLLIVVALVALLLMPAVANRLGGREQPSNETAERDLFSDPRFEAGGRRQLFVLFPFIGRGAIVTHGNNALHIILLAVAATVTWWFQRKSVTLFPRELKALLYASFLCFGIAWAVALITSSFPLHLPSRYTRAALPLSLLIFVVINVETTMQRMTTLLYRLRRQSFPLLLAVALLAAAIALFAPQPQASFRPAFVFRYRQPLLLLLGAVLLLLGALSALRARVEDEPVDDYSERRLSRKATVLFSLAFLIPSLLYVSAVHAEFLVASPEERQLYQYLETLPKEVRIGGDPQVLSSVPFFSKRAVLFSEEDPHPEGDVMMDAMLAYYAQSPVDVVAFCERQEVDYLILDAKDYEAKRISSGRYLFEPYDSELRQQLAGRTQFALAEVPEEIVRFRSGSRYVVACRDLALGTSSEG